MKKILIMLFCFFVLLFCTTPLLALDKNEVKDALLQMDVDDYNTVQEHILQVANESALKTGYAKGSVMGGAGGFYYFMPSTAVNSNKPAQVADINSMLGGAGGFMYNLNEKWSLGGLFGGFSGWSEKKVINDYWNYSVWGAFQLVAAQYKPVINDNIILGIDLGAGLAEGGYAINDTNETLTGQDVVRSGSGLAYILGLDLKKRLTNTWFIDAKLGILSSVIDPLKRAGVVDSGKQLNLGSTYVSIGMGGNF